MKKRIPDREKGLACINLRFTSAMHKRFKLLCVKENITMNSKMKILINKELKK